MPNNDLTAYDLPQRPLRRGSGIGAVGQEIHEGLTQNPYFFQDTLRGKFNGDLMGMVGQAMKGLGVGVAGMFSPTADRMATELDASLAVMPGPMGFKLPASKIEDAMQVLFGKWDKFDDLSQTKLLQLVDSNDFEIDLKSMSPNAIADHLEQEAKRLARNEQIGTALGGPKELQALELQGSEGGALNVLEQRSGMEGGPVGRNITEDVLQSQLMGEGVEDVASEGETLIEGLRRVSDQILGDPTRATNRRAIPFAKRFMRRDPGVRPAGSRSIAKEITSNIDPTTLAARSDVALNLIPRGEKLALKFVQNETPTKPAQVRSTLNKLFGNNEINEALGALENEKLKALASDYFVRQMDGAQAARRHNMKTEDLNSIGAYLWDTMRKRVLGDK